MATDLLQPVHLACPNCGAGLGPAQNGEHLCAYCGHRSLPPRPVHDPAQHAIALAAALAGYESRRAQVTSRIEELRQRRRDAEDATRRVNGWVMIGIGSLFLAFAVACFVGTASMAVAGGSFGGVLIFGVFWLALGGVLFSIGLRYGRAGGRVRRLRTSGLRGRATVVSYKQSHLMLDGNPRFELVLNVEVPGRTPYLVKQSDWVVRPETVTTGAELPVFVSPSNGLDVLVDWFAA